VNELRDFDEESFLRDHFDSSEFRGRLENPSSSQTILNRTCGDQVTLDILLENHVIRGAGFEAQGCLISQAAASILCELIQGKSVDQLKQFDAPSMLKQIRIPLSPRRMQCGLLTFQALKQMLHSLDGTEVSSSTIG
jgi:nitrogen fixation NifU-like protein